MTVKQVSNVLNAQLDGGTHYQQQKSSAPALPEALLPLTQKPTDIHVDLSEAAKMRSKGGAMISNQDIDESDLPDMIKQLLKKLREIKQKLMAKIIHTISISFFILRYCNFPKILFHTHHPLERMSLQTHTEGVKVLRIKILQN